MAYIQWHVTASSGNWWYPWTMVCDFSSALNPLSFPLAFTLAVLLMAEHLVLLAPSFFKEDWMTPKHHPVSLFGFQGWLYVPSMCCATCSCSSPHQPAGWLTDAAALRLRWGILFAMHPIPLPLVKLGDAFSFFVVIRIMSCLGSGTEILSLWNCSAAVSLTTDRLSGQHCGTEPCKRLQGWLAKGHLLVRDCQRQDQTEGTCGETCGLARG